MKLKIISWNIGYAFGLGSEGFGNPAPISCAQYEENLNSICATIRAENPDVVLLQEVDFHASRSYKINQLEWISRATGLLHRDHLVSWDHLYLPYPGLNPKYHWGRIVSGGGILSRYPLKSLQKDLLPKPRENHFLYNFFYLSRYLQIAELDLGKDIAPLHLINLHLEAFSKENRELHLIKLQNRLIDYNIDLAGGDFNRLVQVDSQTETNGWLALAANEPTFPSNEPKEILDGFVYKKSRIQCSNLQVIPAGIAADHLPVSLEIKIT